MSRQLFLILLLVGLAEAGTDLNCTMVNGACVEFSSGVGKKVAMPYEDFLQVIATVEHSEKLKNRAMAENGVLLKLKDEQGTIIKLQADQIKACEKIVQQQEQLGATQEQLSQAVEMELRKVRKELEREKRLSRYKSEAFWVGVVAVGLWVMN